MPQVLTVISHQAQRRDNTSSMMAILSDGYPSKKGHSQSKPHPAVHIYMNTVLSACHAASTTAMHTPQLTVCNAACRHMQMNMLVLYNSDDYIEQTI